jgi:subtilisin family serine protease
VTGVAALATLTATLLTPASSAGAATGHSSLNRATVGESGRSTAARRDAWIHGTARWTATRGRTGASAVTVPSALGTYLQGDRTDIQWALRAIHVEQAWEASRGAGVTVATVDTGADTTSTDLAGRLLPGAYLTPTGTIAVGARTDRLGHGTHVAGIIAGTDDGKGITGIAPEAKVLPVNVDTTDDQLTGKQVAAAVTWASTHGAKVINLSLGFADVAMGKADVTAVCQAVKAAVDRKVVVVAAAGNDGIEMNDAEAPANCPGAISVAALDNELHPAPWSSFDGSVSVAAPGAAIYSTVSTAASPLKYASESGTSMASPVVAGIAALILAQHPDWTPAQVARQLADTATDVGPAGRDPRTGAGAVDAAAAVGVDAGAPEAQPAVVVAADPYASRLDSTGNAVFDQVELHWVPDPSFPATGYRITRWTASGTTSTTVSAGTVRARFAAGPAAYQVTALGADGEVPSAPVWFPLAGQDYTPLYPVTGLKATWNRSGGIAVRWTNPPRNAGRADQYAIVINGDVVRSAEKVKVPSAVTVPASAVPGGDLSISVILGSSSTLDVEESRTALAARVPFSGTATAAGKGRYRVDLALAPSRRSACGGSRCTGATVSVTSAGRLSTTRLDNTGHAVVLVAARAAKGGIKVSVTMSGRSRLTDRALTVPVR